MEVTDRRALSVSRFIDQCGVCRVVAPVDFFVVCSCLGHTRIFFVWFSWVDAVIIQRARERAHRQIQRKDATEDILDSDQYGRHSRGMQRRYRGEYDYFHSLLSPFCHFFDNRSIAFSVMSCCRLASSVLKWYFVCEFIERAFQRVFEHALPILLSVRQAFLRNAFAYGISLQKYRVRHLLMLRVLTRILCFVHVQILNSSTTMLFDRDCLRFIAYCTNLFTRFYRSVFLMRQDIYFDLKMVFDYIIFFELFSTQLFVLLLKKNFLILKKI